MPPPQRADRQSHQLQQLAALKSLGGDQQAQQQLQQSDQHARMQQAMSLLGLMQQKEEGQQQQAFRESQLAQNDRQFQDNQKLTREHYANEDARFAGSQNNEAARLGLQNSQFQQSQDLAGMRLANDSSERAAALALQNQGQIDNKEHQQNALAASLFSDASRFPGMDLQGALNIGGLHDPAMLGKADTLLKQQRQQAIATVYPQLKLLTEPTARETFGRSQLSKFPGGYEEALALAYPQNKQQLGQASQGQFAASSPALQTSNPIVNDLSDPSLIEDLLNSAFNRDEHSPYWESRRAAYSGTPSNPITSPSRKQIQLR